MEYIQFLINTVHNIPIREYVYNTYYYLYPIDYSSPENFLKTVDTNIADIITSYLTLEQITEVHDDSTIFKYINLLGYTLPSLREANQNGYLNLFKYLVRNDHLVTEYEMIVSITHGHLDILKHILELGHIAPQNCLIDVAIEVGHKHIVEYLISIGLKPLESSVDLAIEYGKHEIAEYIKKKLMD